MTRDRLLQLLAEHRQDLDKFGVSTLAVFGSVARNQAQAHSDVDLLVEFAKPVGLFEFVRLQLYLEALLGRPVDLVTPDALRPEFREAVLDEAIRAA